MLSKRIVKMLTEYLTAAVFCHLSFNDILVWEGRDPDSDHKQSLSLHHTEAVAEVSS